MTWPSPTLPPPELDDRADPLVDTPQSEDERRRLSAVPAAAWVGVLGGALVLIAAAIVVASTWSSIGASFRFGGLMVATGGLLFASERLRVLVSTTAGIIAHVGTFLVAPIGIAAMSVFGFTWPTCLLVGGLAAVIATELQSRRWTRTTMHLAQVAAIALAATGLAALAGTSAGLVAAIVAGALLAVGGQLRASALAMLAVFSPALTALADVGVGAGTLERAGLVGEALQWSGPVVGLLAALILGVAAQQRRNSGLMLAAVASPLIGVVTGLAAIDGPAMAWLSVPALVVISAELAWWLLPNERRRDLITWIGDSLAGLLAAPALISPWFVGEISLGSTQQYPWAIPAAATTFALAMVTLRWHRADRPVVDAGIASVLTAALATLVAFDVHVMAIAAAAIVATALAAYLSRRIHPAAVYVPAAWALLATVAVTPTASAADFAIAATLLALLLAVVAFARARLAGAAGWFGWIESVGIVVVTATAATKFLDVHQPLAAIVGGLVAGLALVVAERRLAASVVASWTAIGVVTLDAAAGTAGIDDRYWFGWLAISVAMGVVGLRWRPAMHAAAAAAVVTLAIAAEALTISAEQFVGLAMIAVAVLTGCAFALQRRSEFDAAAAASGLVLLVGTGLDIGAGWISAMWVVAGLQIWSYGLVTRRWWLHLLGAVTTAAATISWWFTSGLNDWAVELVEPLDITVGDLWMLTATVMALIAGWAARATVGTTSWLAYGPGLTIGGLWLLSVEIERGAVWAIPAALTFGIVATGIGAWRRLAAPLVGGTIITAATVFVASGSDLRAIPTWTWLAVGGLALLGTAVLIERAGKTGPSGLRELVDSWS